MLAKYKVDYAIPFNHHENAHHHITDDPVACEEFLCELLERGFRIKAITHEGVALPLLESDRLIKTAARMMTTRHICRTLDIDTADAHHRFGTPA